MSLPQQVDKKHKSRIKSIQLSYLFKHINIRIGT
jgi:hypothetical protein